MFSPHYMVVEKGPLLPGTSSCGAIAGSRHMERLRVAISSGSKDPHLGSVGRRAARGELTNHTDSLQPCILNKAQHCTQLGVPTFLIRIKP